MLKTWPYHLILCWGFTESTFQLKAFTPPPAETHEGKEDDPLGGAGPRVLIPTPSLRNIKVPEGSAEIEAVVMRTSQVRRGRFGKGLDSLPRRLPPPPRRAPTWRLP